MLNFKIVLLIPYRLVVYEPNPKTIFKFSGIIFTGYTITDFSITMYLFKTQFYPRERMRDELTICVTYDDLLFLLKDLKEYAENIFIMSVFVRTI